nr:immunoglobulin heavy chain junction region [Macaca mulatta]MOV35907.1 immunoglobulin heavy chain junction region [Macaca mulatta]MOV36853.1 immunoglobulin heavy chain junction region [Macaca mulatta]MOX91494.1 immunoglobulin heavy chain junction region [Macaca mulatta]MOX91602.1 immunoglobulin heavy chain junction region [Macaca mulatta]
CARDVYGSGLDFW